MIHALKRITYLTNILNIRAIELLKSPHTFSGKYEVHQNVYSRSDGLFVSWEQTEIAKEPFNICLATRLVNG